MSPLSSPIPRWDPSTPLLAHSQAKALQKKHFAKPNYAAHSRSSVRSDTPRFGERSRSSLRSECFLEARESPALPPAQLAPALRPFHPVLDSGSQVTIPREFCKDGTNKTETVLTTVSVDDRLLCSLFNMVPLLYFSFPPHYFWPCSLRKHPHTHTSPPAQRHLFPGSKWDRSEYREGAKERLTSHQHLLLPHAWLQDQGCVGANCLHPFLMGLMSLALNISRLSETEGSLRFLYGDDVSNSLQFKEAASGDYQRRSLF